DVSDLAQTRLSRSRIHRYCLDIEVADIIGDAVAATSAQTPVRSGPMEQDFNRFQTAKRCPDTSVGSNTAPACFMNNSCPFGRLKYAVERIRHLYDKTGGKLTVMLSGIHKTWGVRDKLPLQ